MLRLLSFFVAGLAGVGLAGAGLAGVGLAGAGLAGVGLAGAMLISALAVHAQSTVDELRIELIVFEDLRDQALDDEYWAIDPGTPPSDDAIQLTLADDSVWLVSEAKDKEESASLTSTDEDPASLTLTGGESASLTPAVRLLLQPELTLTPEWTALRQSRNYRPLLHLGWRQPDWPRSQARAVYLRLYPETSQQHPTTADPMPQIEGSIRVHQQQYLHVALDLIYRRQPAAPTATDIFNLAPKHYRLKTTHRIRFNELHYIDHPLFGVLLQIPKP